MIRISNCIQIKLWDVITNQCHKFNGGLAVNFMVWMNNYIPHGQWMWSLYPCAVIYPPLLEKRAPRNQQFSTVKVLHHAKVPTRSFVQLGSATLSDVNNRLVNLSKMLNGKHPWGYIYVFSEGYQLITSPKINSLVRGRYSSSFRSVISYIAFKVTGEIANTKLPQNTFDDNSTLLQVMAWCRPTTSHYSSQC